MNRYKAADPVDDRDYAGDPDVREPDVVPDPYEDYPKLKQRPQHEVDALESY